MNDNKDSGIHHAKIILGILAGFIFVQSCLIIAKIIWFQEWYWVDVFSPLIFVFFFTITTLFLSQCSKKNDPRF
jgi:Co/Zn/Cd efflux system component